MTGSRMDTDQTRSGASDQQGPPETLRQKLSDLEIALTTAVEHGDIVEADLAATNDLLQAEIRERQLAEGRLTRVLMALEKRKTDLELLVTTLTEHGDVMDAEWLSRYTQVEALSLADPLTALGNRRAFDKALEQAWTDARDNDKSLTVAFIDLDFFKSYNDQFGHPAGDRALAVLARELTAVNGSRNQAAYRYGGEEFIVIWPRISADQALAQAESLRQRIWDLAISHPTTPAGRVTISIGLAHCGGNDSDFKSAEDLVAKADACVYAAKSRGRNQVHHAVSAGYGASSGSADLPRERQVGAYSLLHEGGTGEGLSLSFLPSSLPLQRRWRNNGLSADFLADYVTNFLPFEETATEQEQLMLRDSISFIANELLENAMKYGVSAPGEPITVRLSLLDGQLVFAASNPATNDVVTRLEHFVGRLDSGTVEDAHLAALEAQSEGGDDSGLGLLTMMMDYDAEVGWKLQPAGTNAHRVTTQVRIAAPAMIRTD